ncbi:putative ABC transport system substrate-binding protein [Rhizobiales bacterium GAS191]|nr:putative ABC transport system substrate-binding protein [Rhizobiales bacterium GAS191]
MKRREILKLAGVAAIPFSWPTFAQGELRIVALLFTYPADQARERMDVVRKGMQEAGLAEGVDYAFALRFADGVFDRLPGLALELAALKPRVIVASGGAVPVVHEVLPDLTMVFTGYADDPIKNGLAESYAHPGGNTTGNVLNALGGDEALTQKRLGLLKELVPDLKRLGFISTRIGSLAARELNALRGVAGEFGCEIVHYAIDSIDDVESAVMSSDRDGVGALYISGGPLLYSNMDRVMPIVMASGKPTVGTYPEWGRKGLLITYATDPLDGARRAGVYAAKILRGEKPGDLPIEQASKFILVINGRTAKQLGINVPMSLLGMADEVIE